MKKVININFQGQVIPIEETAYEMLQLYVASLRNYFANEEGRDEIINDIESRIAELFGEQLKKGAACITDAEVLRIMDNMGRPADFQAADEGESIDSKKSYANTATSEAPMPGPEMDTNTGRGRLYRDEEDKIIGGVASGLANYFKIDPAIIRVIFVALFFGGGSGLLVYIILWIILPSRSLVNNIRKRLYRDPDEKVIAGVAGGLAKYFDISPAIPRVVFAAPFIFGIISSVWSSIFWNGFPGFIGSFGGGTFIMAYIILWIVLPEARTASEKLEMRGEKVDLNSIRNTVVSDLEGFKNKAQTAGKEIADNAQKASLKLQENLAERNKNLGNEMRYATARNSSGLGNVITILVKAFVYFIIGIVAFALFMASIGLLVAGVSVYPLHEFLLQGSTQHLAAWGTLILFLAVPVLALLVFIIRRLMGVKKSNPIIGYTFTSLWVIGLVCFFVLLGSLRRSFISEVGVRKEISLVQPTDKLTVATRGNDVVVYDRWMDFDGVINISKDTLYLNTVKVSVVKSKDSSYHAYMMKLSKGNEREEAEALAEKIVFDVVQEGNVLYLPESFKIGRKDKWRNQKIMVVIEVPEGKLIEIDESIDDYDYFNIQFLRNNRRGDWDVDWDDHRNHYRKGVPLKMTPDGLDENGRTKIKGIYRFEDNESTIEGEMDIEEGSEPEETNDSLKPVIEKKEKEVYRYSHQVFEGASKSIAQKLRVHSNPLNAMLKF